MTGTFEYEKGDKRDVLTLMFRYNATYPYYSDAVGISPKCGAGARFPKPSQMTGILM